MAYEVHEIAPQQFDYTDWSTHSLDIGIKRGDGKERWLALDQDDLRILISFLRKPLLKEGTSAADASEGLKQLVQWAESALEFSKKSGLP